MTHTKKAAATLLAGCIALGAMTAQDPPKPARLTPAPAGGTTASGAQSGQGPSQEELISKRDEKLKLAFLKKADWLTDYDKARAEAKKSGKPIFTYFSRSYAH